MPEPDTSDKNDDVLSSTASTKPRASDSSPPGPLQSPATIADGPSPAASADRNLAAENAEVEAILDAWASGPQTPQASRELRRKIKRARSTSDARDSPTP